MILSGLAFAMLLAAPEPTVTPTPQAIRGYIVRPGWAVDPATGEYRPLPTQTRLPRPSAETIKSCKNPPDRPMGSAAYRDCDVEVVIGVVRDVDLSTAENTYPDLALGKMILLDIEEAFPADPGTSILFDQALHGSPPWSGPPVVKGDRVLVTLLRRPPDYSWGCGRLRPCNGPAPTLNWVGVELFRPAEWP